jgi:GTP diphosphokinase / guanosine-3',5'-bis(diphosphate) 3'-diphosphatase
MDINELIGKVAIYTESSEVEPVLTAAFQIASNAHDGFKRISGEPFLSHPLAVAGTLAEWHAPLAVIVEGLLHDILSADYSRERSLDHVRHELKPEIFQAMETITKLNGFFRRTEGGDFESEAEAKDFWSHMTSFLQKDADAVVIKIADRLHNFKTSSALTCYFQERFARIAHNLLIPLTQQLGMGGVQRQLEDCFFEMNYPAYSKILKQGYIDSSIRREIEKVLEDLQKIIHASMSGSSVRWQASSLYEVSHEIKLDKLMQAEPLPLRMADLGSFVILVATEDACYQTLGIIHKLCQSMKGQFHDFIGEPKENGYRSLHTVVKHSSGNLIRIFIRSYTMDFVAEYGITARWWGVTEDLLPALPQEATPIGEIQVFTPNGGKRYFPNGSTVLDFAYNIHTDLGHKCIGALVNGEHAELHRSLHNGDTIEIIQGEQAAGPVLDWLGYVRTDLAIHRIRQWLIQNQRSDMVERGHRLLDTELWASGWDPANTKVRQLISRLASKENMKNTEDLLISIGVGRHKASKILADLKSLQMKSVSSTDYVEPALDVKVPSQEEARLPRIFAKCCKPIPSNDIVGYRRSDGVLVIHKRNCPQIKEPEKATSVKWSTTPTQLNYVIFVEASNRPGLESDISTAIFLLGIDMQGFTTNRRPDGVTAEVYIYLGTTTAKQRSRIVKTLEAAPYVNNVDIIHSSFLSSSPEHPSSPRVTPTRNPYGPGLAEGSRFYGRETECKRISSLIADQDQSTAILLWGQKRIGKTSLLLRLKAQAQGDYLPIYIDMQGIRDVSTIQFLYQMMSNFSQAIRATTQDFEQGITTPQLHRLRKDPLGHFDTFMAQVQKILQNQALVVILDEFQCLSTLRDEDISLGAIISRLRSLALHRKGLHFILSGGGLLSQFADQSGIISLFNITHDERLGSLRSSPARRLIRDGLTRVGGITELAIDLLFNLTGGHPFYLQLLCFRLYEQAQEERTMITQYMVSQNIEAWLQEADKIRFQHLWEGHGTTSAQKNKLILSAIAELTSTHEVTYDHLASALCSVMPEQDLLLSLNDLVSLGVLRRNQLDFAIEIELFALWLRFHWPLKLALKEARTL